MGTRDVWVGDLYVQEGSYLKIVQSQPPVAVDSQGWARFDQQFQFENHQKFNRSVEALAAH